MIIFCKLQKAGTPCTIEVRSDFENSSAPLLEFCSPLTQETKQMKEKLMAWVQGHEDKILTYLQAALAMVSGLIIQLVLKGKSGLKAG